MLLIAGNQEGGCSSRITNLWMLNSPNPTPRVHSRVWEPCQQKHSMFQCSSSKPQWQGEPFQMIYEDLPITITTVYKTNFKQCQLQHSIYWCADIMKMQSQHLWKPVAPLVSSGPVKSCLGSHNSWSTRAAPWPCTEWAAQRYSSIWN